MEHSHPSISEEVGENGGLQPLISEALKLPDPAKVEIILSLSRTLQPSHLAQIHSHINSLLIRDFLSLLPIEISIHILSFLGAQDVARCALVSKKWNALTNDNAVWRNLYLRKGWFVDGEKAIGIGFTDKSLLKTDSLNGNSEFSDGIIPMDREEDVHMGVGRSSNQKFNNSIRFANIFSSLRRNRLYKSHRTSASKSSLNSSSSPMSQNPTTYPIPLNRVSSIEVNEEWEQMINWKYLYYQRNLLSANMRKGQCVKYSFEGHEEGVYCAQMDEQRIISGSRDDTIKIWPLPSQNADPSLPIQASHTLRGHTASVLCLQFTATHIFSGSSDCTIRIWSLETYECVKTLRGHTEAVLNLRVLDDKIVSCSKDKTLRVWNFEGQELGVMRGHRAAVNAVALGTWRRQTKEPDQCEEEPSTHGETTNWIVSGSGDRTIKLWSATTHDIVHTLEGHTRGIACLSFSAPYIFSGSSDQTIKIWSIDTLSCIRTLSGHTELVRTLTVDRELGVIVSGGYDCAIRVWEWEMFRHGAMESADYEEDGPSHSYHSSSDVRCIWEARGTSGDQDNDDPMQGTAGSIGHSNRVFNVGLTMGRVVSASQDMKVFLWDFRHGVDMRGLLKTL